MASKSPSSSWAMADVSGKETTHRLAVASGRILLSGEAMSLLRSGKLPKGDPLPMAELAGIMAAKQTPTLIPLCHPISLNRVAVKTLIQPDDNAVDVYCFAEIAEKTGVEMEALMGLNVALLTIWDLVKPVSAALEITNVKLLYKSGGKRGTWTNPQGLPGEVELMIKDFSGS